MRIIENWQYRYIEKSLYNFLKIKESPLPTEKTMIKAIELAQNFFAGTGHEQMLQHYYFKADKYRRKYTNAGHYRLVCEEYVLTEEANGYVIRREIIYRVAMNCYALGLFQINDDLSDLNDNVNINNQNEKENANLRH